MVAEYVAADPNCKQHLNLWLDIGIGKRLGFVYMTRTFRNRLDREKNVLCKTRRLKQYYASYGVHGRLRVPNSELINPAAAELGAVCEDDVARCGEEASRNAA